MLTRHSPVDRFFISINSLLNRTAASQAGTGRASPATHFANTEPLTAAEQAHAAALMRVNHSGEIAAQALYHGQAATAKSVEVRQGLMLSAAEEADHLIWCRQRIDELGGETSKLEAVWYWGSYLIGAAAGASGDKWSLGFIKETEDQVIAHLNGHLAKLPKADSESRMIIRQMIMDERAHADMAVAAGGEPLPAPVKMLMKATAKVMTFASYRV